MRTRPERRAVLSATTAATTRFLFATYNCLSLRQDGRNDDISEAFRTCSAYALQGTRKFTGDDPCLRTRTKDFVHFDFGYAHGGNAHTGVQIAIHRRHIGEQSVKQIAYPDQKYLRGRIGCVRVVGPRFDHTYIAAYLPPDTGSARAQRDYTKCVEWLEKFVMGLPARTVPIVGIDANDKLGLVPSPGGDAPLEHENVGEFYRERQRPRSDVFLSFLKTTDLIALNTFYNTGATYFSATSETYSSRIDYVLIPYSYFLGREHLYVAWVDHHKGDRIQMIKGPRPIDHRPMFPKLGGKLDYKGRSRTQHKM